METYQLTQKCMTTICERCAAEAWKVDKWVALKYRAIRAWDAYVLLVDAVLDLFRKQHTV